MTPYSKVMDLPLRTDRYGYHARLEYTSDDPYAATLVIPLELATRTVDVRWLFARDLLRDGLSRATDPAGDVQVRPGRHPSRLAIRLRSDAETVTFDCAKVLVARFCTRIYAAVPAGQEHRWLDLDAGILELLGEQA